MPDPEIERFWRSYVASLPAGASVPEGGYTAEGFGDTPELMDELGALVLRGEKTATCSALWAWEAEGEPIPTVGEKTIVLDGRGRPLCIIENTEVSVRPFCEVDEDFAIAEGEGDRSLASWRDAHQGFFTRTLQAIGRTPTRDMPVVCQRFIRIYPTE